MTAATVAWSLLSVGLFVGAGLLVAVAVKRLCFPAWRGSPAVTVIVLIWLCWALALGQLLGTVGLLRRLALLTAAATTAALAVAVSEAMSRSGRRRALEPSHPTEANAPRLAGDPLQRSKPDSDGWEQQALSVGTVLLVLLVAVIWIARTAITLHVGINDPDSLFYHLGFIATFAHSGYADQHRLLIPGYPVQFYPANDELLSAIALAFTHSMAFAAAKNLVFGGLALVAAHALGTAYGAGRLVVAAAAVVLGFPVMAFVQPGEGVNDTLLLLVVVGGLAILSHAQDRPAPYILALACAGVALGVKLSAIVPAAALGVLSVLLALARVPRRRWRWVGAGVLASAALGGSWYIRNAITYGNPVPPVRVAFGPLQLHTIPTAEGALGFSVASYLVRGRYLGLFARGLVRGLGPLIVALAAFWAFGTVAGLRSRDGFRRCLSVFAVIALIGYVSTPATAWGPPSRVPVSFVINLRYATPALLAGLVAGALAMAR